MTMVANLGPCSMTWHFRNRMNHQSRFTTPPGLSKDLWESTGVAGFHRGRIEPRTPFHPGVLRVAEVVEVAFFVDIACKQQVLPISVDRAVPPRASARAEAPPGWSARRNGRSGPQWPGYWLSIRRYCRSLINSQCMPMYVHDKTIETL